MASRWIDSRFLPIKLHYLLFFGGQSAVLPYLPIIAKQLGISATALGVIFAVLPFAAFVTVPYVCSLADKYKAVKLMLMIAILMTGFTYGGIAFLKPIEKQFSAATGSLSCTSFGTRLSIDEINIVNGTCNSTVKAKCSCLFLDCDGDESSEEQLSCGISSLTFAVTVNDDITVEGLVSDTGTTYPSICAEDVDVNCEISCDTIHPCLELGEEILDRNIYRTHQFWVFLVLMVSSWICASTVVSLADSLCYQLLEGQKDTTYGKQRLWGTFGWGGAGSVVGYLFNETKDANQEVDYTVGFIFMSVMYGCDLIVLYFSNPIKANSKATEDPSEPNFVRTLTTLLREPPVVVFILEVLVIGMLTGLMWSFSFWYFEDVGTNHTVMGLVIAVQCFAGELPFFFFSDVIIRFFGHFLTISVCFMAYAIRYVIYANVINPWLFLPAEIFHGPAYSLFYSTMTSYAKKIAPAGSEASVQGIMAGAATAGLVGGLAMDKFGGRKTFLTSGFVAAACCAVYVALHYLYLRRKRGFKELRENMAL